MATVSDVLRAVEALAPPQFAFSFDHVGLQAGDPGADVNGIVCALDCTRSALNAARSLGASVFVSHHPVIWEPLGAVRPDDVRAAIVIDALRSNIALIAAHTNWDCAPGGVNDILASRLGLQNVRPFGPSSDAKAYKLTVFTPRNTAESLIDALASAGAGKIGLYERCAYWGEGIGTFRGLEGSQPTVGTAGVVERVEEARVETVVPAASLARALASVRSVHPYEEPAIDVVPMQNGAGFPLGRVGELPKELPWDALAGHVSRCLGASCRVWPVPGRNDARVVAVIGGAGDEDYRAALGAGADVLLTGEVRHHISIDAPATGIAMIEAGHFATEHPAMEQMADRLRILLPGVAVHVHTPDDPIPGRAS